MWVGEILPTYIKKIIIMKKFSVFIVLICICIGFSGCALFLPVWECLEEPYPTTYYYYGGCYHTTPPPHPHTHYRTYHHHRPHKPKVTHTHNGNTHRPNSKGGHRGSHNGRGGQQSGRGHKR
jgi:hypothetical protein